MHNLAVTVQNWIGKFWNLMELLLVNFWSWKLHNFQHCLIYVILPVTLRHSDVSVSKHYCRFHLSRLLGANDAYWRRQISFVLLFGCLSTSFAYCDLHCTAQFHNEMFCLRHDIKWNMACTLWPLFFIDYNIRSQQICHSCCKLLFESLKLSDRDNQSSSFRFVDTAVELVIFSTTNLTINNSVSFQTFLIKFCEVIGKSFRIISCKFCLNPLRFSFLSWNAQGCSFSRTHGGLFYDTAPWKVPVAEMLLKGHWRSSTVTLFDRLHVTSY